MNNTDHNRTSTAIGYNIRQVMRGEWHIVNSLHRSVAVRKITKEDNNFQTCIDCKSPAELFVIELTRFTPKGKRSKYPLVWGWCGVCDIDGDET